MSDPQRFATMDNVGPWVQGHVMLGTAVDPTRPNEHRCANCDFALGERAIEGKQLCPKWLERWAARRAN